MDWDEDSKGPVAKSLKIPRRFTLVAPEGRQELGRVVAATSKTDIKALLDGALEAD